MPIKKPSIPKAPKFEEVQFPTEKSLLIGTIFCEDNEVQRKWLDLQLDFIQQTTHDYDHVAVLYGEKSDYFSSKTQVINVSSAITNSKAHVLGLRYLKEFFRSRINGYRNFLFLDSDAFPINNQWQHLLDQKMLNHKIALPLRTENLETRIHASILLSKRESIDDLDFTTGIVGNDLIGDEESDVVVRHFQDDRRKDVFPLLRSNKLNLHPVMCGIYYNCFYHHCCGSGRDYNLRSRDYWDHICDKEVDVSSYTEELMKNPTEFIGKLRYEKHTII